MCANVKLGKYPGENCLLLFCLHEVANSRIISCVLQFIFFGQLFLFAFFGEEFKTGSIFAIFVDQDYIVTVFHIRTGKDRKRTAGPNTLRNEF